MFSLENKRAFITGGAAGIGLAVAKRFITAGARVVISDIADGTAVAEETPSGTMNVSDARLIAT